MERRLQFRSFDLARNAVCMILCAGVVAVGSAGAAEPVDYVRQIKPILKQRCYSCHGALKHQARLRLDTGESIRRGGESGPGVEPGRSDESVLIDRVTDINPTQRMPPEGAPLTKEEINLLSDWINQGARSPVDEAPEADPRKHWAFLKPTRPDVPRVNSSVMVANPVDAFLAAARDRRGLIALPPAAPHVLLRRLYLDLIGLPPTGDQLREFLADPSEPAYRRVVDRLLASPQYGERWARHWMDVWRYSDWYGRRAVPDVTNSYAQIWRWRDWIVRSLNRDKGYDRMVQEMLAADELAPTDMENIVATGFLVRNWYRWNYNSWMKDNVEHTGKAFLALTFNCAHCHDHKYDPIKHEDYFALRAFFEPLELRHDRMPDEPDPGPFPKYEYGKAYGPIHSGIVRVFDEKLDARTLFYTRGESRNIVADRPPIPPGLPAFLGGDSLRIQPIDLPVEAFYPGLKPFAQRQERTKSQVALAEAEKALAAARRNSGSPEIATARLTAARTQLAAIDARIAADRVQYGLTPGDKDAYRRKAVAAERQANVDQAAAELTQVIMQLRDKSGSDLTKANAAAAQASRRLEAARAALQRADGDYTRLGPIYATRSTGRRTALARLITDRGNPLTARVAVNHVWRWHFGTPLVATTSDFGRNGKRPSHPELLDWLAVELMEPGTQAALPWSLKPIHRLIVTSAAYRMGSHADSDPQSQSLATHNRSIDPDNTYHWRFQPRRMEAEEVRDSLLHAAHEIDSSMGGPDIDFTQGLSSHRRSLYFSHHGEARMPFLELFDAPDACDCYRRTSSIVPQQSLALVNNDLLVSLSQNLAEQLWASSRRGMIDRAEQFVNFAFEQVLSRQATARERAISVAFLARQTQLLRRSPAAKQTLVEPAAKAQGALIHALFNHNDFITIR